MRDKILRISEIGAIEERLMKARLEAVRAAINHAGEKGRALEQYATSLLRSFLPAEYGLSTGFVAYRDKEGVQLSSQLDVIIFDALAGAPLYSLESCEVFPLEAVYGYVEVKASLASSSTLPPADNSIESCIRRNADLRTMTARHYEALKSTKHRELPAEAIPIRGYVIAFEGLSTTTSNIQALAQRVGIESRSAGAHLHGVLIPDVGLLYTVPADRNRSHAEDTHHVMSTTSRPLLTFKGLLLDQLGWYPRQQWGHAGIYGSYFDFLPSWNHHRPTSES